MNTIVALLVSVALACAGTWHARAGQEQPAAACATRAEAKTSGAIRVPIDVSNNHVFVLVCSGDRPLHFLLDTGAAGNTMDLDVAKSLGAELQGTFEARGAGAGTSAGARLKTQKIMLAGTSVGVDVKGAIDLKAMTPREGRPIEGILGHSFINEFVVAIDYANREMRLYDKRTFSYAGAGMSVPLTFADNHPIIDAAIRLADGEVIPGRFIVDVGASPALGLTKPFVEQHRLRERTGTTVQRPSGGGVGGQMVGTTGRVAALKIGTIEIASPVTQMYGDAAGVFSGNPNWVGNIGGEVLRRFTAYFDYDRKRMILEPNAARDEPFESDMSGASFMNSKDATRLLVDFVLPGSAAAEAGLVRGDVILAIGAEPVHPRSLLELRARVRREGEVITLTVERDGAARTVTFRTRRII